VGKYKHGVTNIKEEVAEMKTPRPSAAFIQKKLITQKDHGARF
jgi:hypothetical protein